MTVAEVIKEVSVRWAQMDDFSRQPYVEKAQQDKLRFETEMRVYKDHKDTKAAHYSLSEEHCDVVSSELKLLPSLKHADDQSVSACCLNTCCLAVSSRRR